MQYFRLPIVAISAVSETGVCMSANNLDSERAMTTSDHTNDTEKAMLGAILFDPVRVLRLLSDKGAGPELFNDTHIRKAVETTQILHAAGRAVDVLTLADAVQNTPGPAEGWTMFLNACLDLCPALDDIPKHLTALQDRQRRRRIADLGAKITEAAVNGQAVANIITDLRVGLDAFDSTTNTLTGINARLLLDTEPPAPDQIFGDAFDAGDKVSVIGSSKMRKSFFVLQAAICMAAGRDFLPWKIVKPRRVLLAQFEIKAEHFHRRVRNIARAMSISIEDIGDRLLIFNCRGIIGQTAIERIEKEAKKHHAEVVVFDPLYKLTEGDENAAKDMKPTLAAFDRLAEATGAAVIYVHHDAKGHAGDRDSRDRGAGSNVGRRDDDFCITITAHDTEESSVVIDCLWRNYKPRDPFTATWTERGCFEYMPAVPAVKKTSRSRSATTTVRPELETYQDAAMSLIAKKPISISLFREKIEAMSGMNRERQRRLIDIMLADGRLAEYCIRGKGLNKAWIGTPEQIEEMRQMKMNV